MWKSVRDRVKSGKRVGLVVMVDSTGSGPNRPGAKMAIDADGHQSGTVGGGSSEFALVNVAGQMLSEPERELSKLIKMSHKPAAGTEGSGMICSGEQQFAVLVLDESDLPAITAIVTAEAENQSAKITITPDGLEFLPNESFGGTEFKESADGWWCYTESLGGGIVVSLIGGGHVSLALSPLLSKLGMRVRVLDNRSGLATMAENCSADEKLVIDYASMRQYIPAGKMSYVCIMTFGHKHDFEVLEQLAEYPLGYLGLMGSPAKIRQIWQLLRERGISQAALDKIYAPIGVPIASNTPDEIAVSIAAQLIDVRAAK